MPTPPRVSEIVATRALSTGEVESFADSAATTVADELRAALAPGIQLLRPLGAGAMGLVYLGRDPLLKRLVAIKVLSPHLANDEVARSRFVRESEASASISHPNVAGIYLVGELPSRTPYYVMQYIDGPPLSEAISTGAAISEPRARRIIGETASALAAAHARRVVHRDVKPGNILIEKATDRPIVLDFGISAVLQRDDTAIDSRLTTDGMYIGTPTYMSPEQASGEPVTGKSDVYSLGLIAFELLTGKPPFEGTPLQVMAAHVERQAPSLHVMRPGIDAHLAMLVDRCLMKNPEARPTAADVASALVPGARSLVEWPPPGLDGLRGRGARLTWRWLAICAVALLFFALLYARPSLSSPEWTRNSDERLFGSLLAPNLFGDSSQAERVAGDPTSVWIFLVSASVAVLVMSVLLALWYTVVLARDTRRGARDGYPWPVLFDVAWDRYDDTASLVNATGIYALVASAQRHRALQARRVFAGVGVATVVLSVLMPVLWLSGVPPAHASSVQIVSGPEMLILGFPLLAGVLALLLLDQRTRDRSPMRRGAGAESPMQRDLVSAWLNIAGKGTRAEKHRARGRFAMLTSAAASLALVVLVYFVIVVFVVVVNSTTRLSAGRDMANQWLVSLRSDSTRPMSMTELDTIATRWAVPTRGGAPDMAAAYLLAGMPYRTDTLPPPPAIEADMTGARSFGDGKREEQRSFDEIRNVLADSARPTSAQLQSLEPYAHTPWLDIWRRFAASSDYPPMWQYRTGLPGTRYLRELPVARWAPFKDLAYRNSIAGMIALSRGDVAGAKMRGRENIAVGRQLLHGVTLIDNLIGLVIIGIGRGELQRVARDTHDKALADEMEVLRTRITRWRAQQAMSLGVITMTANPSSRDALLLARSLNSSSHYGALLMIATAGYCANAREVLFGSDSARASLLHDIARASGNPRAGELETLANRWLDDLRHGTIETDPVPHDEPLSATLLAPLRWLGMKGFHDRAYVCLVGGVA